MVHVHLLLVRNNKVLFLQKPANDEFDLVQGLLHCGESATTTTIRIAREQLGVEIQLPHLVPALTMHHYSRTSRVGLFFSTLNWTGEPANLREDTYADLAWIHVESLPDNTTKSAKKAMEPILQGKSYVQFGWGGPELCW